MLGGGGLPGSRSRPTEPPTGVALPPVEAVAKDVLITEVSVVISLQDVTGRKNTDQDLFEQDLSDGFFSTL